jgi:hypothetical protein
MKPARLGLAVVRLWQWAMRLFGATTDDGVDLIGVVEFLAAVLVGHDLVLLLSPSGSGS